MGHRPMKQFFVPQIDLQLRAPFDEFIFSPEEEFSDVSGWVGGSAGQTEEPRLPFRTPPRIWLNNSASPGGGLTPPDPCGPPVK